MLYSRTRGSTGPGVAGESTPVARDVPSRQLSTAHHASNSAREVKLESINRGCWGKDACPQQGIGSGVHAAQLGYWCACATAGVSAVVCMCQPMHGPCATLWPTHVRVCACARVCTSINGPGYVRASNNGPGARRYWTQIHNTTATIA